MFFTPHKGFFSSRALRVSAVLMLLSFGLLPGSLTLCLATEEAGCACCSEPASPEQGCCSSEPAPADDDTPCCISIILLPAPWLSTTPPLAAPMVSMSVSVLPAGDVLAENIRQPTALALGPSVSAPTYVRFCCPLA